MAKACSRPRTAQAGGESRSGTKIPRPRGHAGSIPALGTTGILRASFPARLTDSAIMRRNFLGAIALAAATAGVHVAAIAADGAQPIHRASGRAPPKRG
jgi:hypothetical protein